MEIRDNLLARIAEAEREGWLGEVEGLWVSLAGAEEKRARQPHGHAATSRALPGKGTLLDGDANWAPQAHERMESPARADIQRPLRTYPQHWPRNRQFGEGVINQGLYAGCTGLSD
ncbi:hypothetical protein [Streptomyces sp. NPDC095613]|uniref:hypothetical protein n=1 Tax=Streptomyces sp. NPDC095613 TaxID=3155540 RepID=UPI0033304860